MLERIKSGCSSPGYCNNKDLLNNTAIITRKNFIFKYGFLGFNH